MQQCDTRRNIRGNAEPSSKLTGLVAEFETAAVVQTSACRIRLIEKYIPVSKLPQDFGLVTEA